MILILLKKYWRYLAFIATIIGLVFWWDGSVKKAYQKGRDEMALEISNRLKEEAIKKAQKQRAQSEQYQDQKKGLDMLKCKKSLNALFIAMCVSILTACQSSTPPLPTAIKPPADLVQPCPNLPKLSGNTGAEILPWSLQVVHLYNDCKARHKALSEAVQ